MNRTLLIVVCDFLIISILSLGTFSDHFTGRKGTGDSDNIGPPVQDDILDSLQMVLSVEKELQAKLQTSVEVSQTALKEEREIKNRLKTEVSDLSKKKTQLQKLLNSEKGELAKVTSQAKYLTSKLSESDRKNKLLLQNITQKQEMLQKREKELREKTEKLEFTQDNLHASLKSIESLSREVAQSKEYSRELKNQIAEQKDHLSKKEISLVSLQEKLKAIEKEKEELSIQANELEKEISKKNGALAKVREELTAQQNETALNAQKEAFQLNKELLAKEKDLAKLEKVLALQSEQITALKNKFEESETEKEEILEEAQLLENEKTVLEKETQQLAKSMAHITEKSLALQEEVNKRLKTYSNNELFQHFLNKNSVLFFEAQGQGLFSSVTYNREQNVVLAKTPDHEGVLLHYKDSPLKWMHFDSMEDFVVSLQLKGRDHTIPLSSVRVLKKDPRILFLRIEYDALPADSFFEIETKISQFDDALLIRSDEGKYGSFKVRLMPDKSDYFLVPSSLKTRLFGSFSPNPGDLVFSRNGKLLGIMATKNEALRLHDLSCIETFFTGNPINQSLHKETYQKWGDRLDSSEY